MFTQCSVIDGNLLIAIKVNFKLYLQFTDFPP